MIKDFIAIDFETANDSRISAVSIGVVPVCNGEIEDDKCKHYFIRPPENKFKELHTQIHGITWDKVKNEPDFKELWDSSLSSILNKQLIICHNASIDKACLEQLFSHYNIDGEFNFIDTRTLAERYYSFENNKLKTICQCFNIPLENHHNALCDAKACAEVALKMLSEIGDNVEHLIQPAFPQKKQSGHDKFSHLKESHQKITREMLTPDFENVENKENPFYKKKVVISGTYENWPDRNDLASIIKSMGANIDTNVSVRTNILIAGAGVGPKKFEKMQANIDAGKDAFILKEFDLIPILKELNIKIPTITVEVHPASKNNLDDLDIYAPIDPIFGCKNWSEFEQRNELCNLGYTKERNGDIEGAIQIYEELLKETWTPYLAYTRLQIIYRKQKEYEKELRVNKAFLKILHHFNEIHQNEYTIELTEKRQIKIINLINNNK